MTIKALITDLDGTLIPLPGNEQNRRDLVVLQDLMRDRELTLVFATGRHPESVEAAIREFSLPNPDAVICNVGTRILQPSHDGSRQTLEEYHDHLQQRVGQWPVDRIHGLLTTVDGLRLQEQEKQSAFKLSFYTDAGRLDALCQSVRERIELENMPWSLIASVDPFTGDGLLDVLPVDTNKASAIDWWATRAGLCRDEIIYAGDSGNDLAALTAGYHAVIVGNAAEDVVAAVLTAVAANDRHDHIHCSMHSATSGVLDGLKECLEQSPRC